jgi:hypothetical protein
MQGNKHSFSTQKVNINLIVAIKVCGKSFKRSNDTREHELIHQKSSSEKKVGKGRKSLPFKRGRFNYSMDDRMFSEGMPPLLNPQGPPPSHMRSFSWDMHDNQNTGHVRLAAVAEQQNVMTFGNNQHFPSPLDVDHSRPNEQPTKRDSMGFMGLHSDAAPSFAEKPFFNSFTQHARLHSMPPGQESIFPLQALDPNNSASLLRLNHEHIRGHKRGMSFS